jgi:hypothetical protein
MEPTHITKIAPSVAVSVIEKNNTMCNVINVDIVGRYPIPIVIYSVKGEFDSPTTKDDDR